MKIQGKKIRLPGDVVAALTGSISSLPDGMSAGVMARVNPIHGLYGAVLGAMTGSWTTSSVSMSVTTTSALALAAGSAFSEIKEGEKIYAIILLTVTAGIIQLLMGIFKMGFLVRFVSNSVMRGFLSGVAVLIILGQTADFTGNYESEYENKVLKTFDILVHPVEWDFLTIAGGSATLLLIVLIKRTKLNKLSIFFSLVIVAVSVHWLNIDSVKLVGEENQIPSALPPVVLPDFKLLPGLLLSSLAVALIGFIQGAGVSHMKPNPDGSYPDTSGDLRGQGIANVCCGLFSGVPVGGSMGQTSLVYTAGGRSRWANFLCGVFTAIFILLLADLIELLPFACFAAILIMAGIDSINKEEIALIWKTSWHSRIIMLFAFIMTLSLSVQMAVLASVVLTFILHVVRASNRVTLKSIEYRNGRYIETKVPSKLESEKILAIQPYGSLFFAGAYALEDMLPDPGNSRNAVVMLLLRGRKEIGSSFLAVIGRYADELTKREGKLILIGVSDNVHVQLERTGMLKEIGIENIYKSSKIIGEPLRKAWTDAEKGIRSKS